MAREELLIFGKRVKKIRNHLHISQREFAENLGISGSFLSEIEAGKVKPGYEFFKNMTLVYNINPYYLHEEKGEIFLNPESQKESPIFDFGENSEVIKKMLKYFQKSTVVKFAVLQFFQTYIFEKKELIESDIEEQKIKKEPGKTE